MPPQGTRTRPRRSRGMQAIHGERMNQIDLSHRHAVVTGGAQGIGLSIARRLLASGASVSLWDRDEELLFAAQKELRECGAVLVETVDISDASEVAAATTATVEKRSKIDILVANAGIAGPNHTTWEYPINQWKQVITSTLSVCFSAAIQSCRKCCGRA